MSMTESEATALIEWFKTRKGKTLKLNDKGIDCVVEALEEVKQLHAIGTVSEFRELKEKATAKNPILYPFPKCPVCKCILKNEFVNYCDVCGQKIL